MKVIFLDVDGPLNTFRSMQKAYEAGISTDSHTVPLDEEALNNLKALVDATGAIIVVSSTWRRIDEAMFNLGRQLWKKEIRIRDETAWLGKQRGDEVREWLSRHENVESFVILDDDSDMCEFTNTNLVKCPHTTGFGEKELGKAIEVLNRTGSFDPVRIVARDVLVKCQLDQ